MIGYLRGTLVESSEDSAILDVGGVGYELSCSQNTLDSWIVGQVYCGLCLYSCA